MNSLDKDFNNKNFNKLYLLYGNEDYLKNLYMKKFKDNVIDNSYESMNFDFFDDKNINVEKIIDCLEPIPFLSKYRLVIIKNSGLFFEGKKDESEKLCKYCENLPETSILVFVEDKVDKRLKVYKTLSKQGKFIEFKISDKTFLVNWIINILDEKKFKVNTESIHYLIDNIGYSMNELNMEIQKLIDFKFNEKTIINADIDNLCTKSLEMKIFDLIKYLGNKNCEKAISTYNNLLIYKNSPFIILSLMARQFRLILQVKYLLKTKNISQISQELGLRDFVVRECINQSKLFKNKILIEAINDCNKCDLDIKSGLINENLGVEIILIKYSMN